MCLQMHNSSLLFLAFCHSTIIPAPQKVGHMTTTSAGHSSYLDSCVKFGGWESLYLEGEQMSFKNHAFFKYLFMKKDCWDFRKTKYLQIMHVCLAMDKYLGFVPWRSRLLLFLITLQEYIRSETTRRYGQVNISSISPIHTNGMICLHLLVLV
jgi:hypothetical protein